MSRKVKIRTRKLDIEVCQRLADYHLVPVCNELGYIGRWVKMPKYHAQLNGQPGVWGSGKTINEAVGDLILTHCDRFSIQVDFLGKLPR